MDDPYKSDFPPKLFLIYGIIVLAMGIVLGIFVVYPMTEISVAIVVIVVMCAVSCALFRMYYLTAGSRSKYIIKKYGGSTKMILRSDIDKQIETSSKFRDASARREAFELLSSEDDEKK